MTTPPPPVPENGQNRIDEPTGASSESDRGPERIGTLRAASAVDLDAKMIGKIALGLVMATLLVLVVVLSVAGIHSNNQIDRLHTQGVPVTVTVTGCLGLLGGSGSNAAGYSCRGTYTLDGHRYDEALPGADFHRPGSTIASVAVPGDPALVSPVHIVDAQTSSSSVFILPAVLWFVLLVLVVWVLMRRHANRRRAASAS